MCSFVDRLLLCPLYVVASQLGKFWPNLIQSICTHSIKYTVASPYCPMSQLLNIKSFEPEYSLPPSLSHRVHLLCTLPNGLKCLLISDNSSEMISGAMSVNCGSFQDPNGVLGMAHLSEHMVLRGSKTYKPPFSLAQMLYAAGGQLNAYTTGDQSCFYFEISSYAEDTFRGSGFMLETILPIFSSLLSSPIMSEQFVRLEIKAVDDEHNGNRNDEEKVLFHSLRLLANPDHVFSRFATGTQETLSQVSPKKLRKMTQSYVKDNFRPENMSFVLKGPQTVLQLKKLAVANFLGLLQTPPSASKTTSRYSLTSSEASTLVGSLYHDTPLFDDSRPNKNVIKGAFLPKIRVCFPIFHMNYKKNYKAIARTLCNLLGEESPLSLSHLLNTEKKWISSIYVFVQRLFSDIELLVVEVVPTKLAWSRVDAITEQIISYAEYNLGQSNGEDLQKLVEHFDAIDQYNFRNLQPCDSGLDEVLDYAERLNKPTSSPTENSFISDFVTWKDISTAHHDIQEVIRSCFTRSMVKVQVVIPDELTIEQLTHENATSDPYFNFKYALVHSKWGELGPRPSTNGLPAPETALTEQIVSQSYMNTLSTPFKVRDMQSEKVTPTLRAYDKFHEIWTVPASSEKEATFTVFLKFAHLKHTVENAVILDILVELIGEEIRGSLYECEKTGCFWGIFSNVNHSPSIMMSATGTSIAIEHAAGKVFSELRLRIRNLHKTPYDKLRRARVSVRKRYEEQAKSHNIKKVLSSSYLIFESGISTPDEKIEELELLDSDSLRKFGEELLDGKEYRVFLLSNEMYEGSTTDKAYLCEGSMAKPEYPDHSSILLSEGKFYQYSTIESEDDNLSIVMHYTQIGLRSDLHSFALAKLYLYILSTNAMEEIRVKRQLAYTVHSGIRMFQQTFGVYLLIPSGWNNCDFLVDQAEEVLQVVEDMVYRSSEQEFQTKYVEPFIESANQESHDEAGSSLFAALQPQRGSGRRPTSPSFNDHWNQLNQILNGTFDFDSRECEEHCNLESLRKISKHEFVCFVRTHLSVSSPTRSVVAICSHPAQGQNRQREKAVAQFLALKLEKIGLFLEEDQLCDVLLRCNDKNSYSDVMKLLPQCFPHKSQRLKLRKIQLGAMVGGALTSLVGCFSSVSFKKQDPVTLVVAKTMCTDHIQIHQENQLADPVMLADRFEALIGIENGQD